MKQIDSEKLKKLTRKYFIQAKIKESTIFLTIIAGLVFVPYYFGRLISHLPLGIVVPKTENWFSYWGIGMPILMLLAIALIGLVMIGIGLVEVIRQLIDANWQDAEEKAKRQLE